MIESKRKEEERLRAEEEKRIAEEEKIRIEEEKKRTEMEIVKQKEEFEKVVVDFENQKRDKEDMVSFFSVFHWLSSMLREWLLRSICRGCVMGVYILPLFCISFHKNLTSLAEIEI